MVFDQRSRRGLSIAIAIACSIGGAAHAQLTTRYYYDVHGQLVTKADAQGRVAGYAYDQAANRTAVNGGNYAVHLRGDRLAAGEVLMQGQSLTSGDGRFSLFLQEDGNLVLYKNPGAFLWSSATQGRQGVFLTMQSDGNLVLYGVQNQVLWMSGSHGNGGFAVVQTDGNFVAYTTYPWNTGTCCY